MTPPHDDGHDPDLDATACAGPAADRWSWLTPGRATGIVAALLLAAWLVPLFGPEPRLVVSERTTWITTPLAADGLPDFSAHLLARLGPAPPPEENAAVPLLAALWPMGFVGPDLDLVCKAIGIPVAKPARPPLVPAGADPLLKDLADFVADGSSRPWTAEEAPDLRAWADRNDDALDLIAEAAGRPRYFLPSPSLLRSRPEPLMATLLSDLQAVRAATASLACRGMGHAGAGRFADAWRDIHATHRLGRLLAPADRPHVVVSALLAANISIEADRCTLELLGLPDLPDDVLAAIRRDLAALPPHANLAAALATERLIGIDSVVWTQRSDATRQELLGSPGRDGKAARALCSSTSLDWNGVAMAVNDAYSRLEEAAGRKSFAERRTAANAVLLGSRVPPPKDPLASAAQVARLGLSRVERTDFVGRKILECFLPNPSAVDATLTKRDCLSDLVRLAAALEAARRADPGRGFPQRLDDLVPGHLDAVPADPFTDGPLSYARRGDGYLLYSRGRNLADDGGSDIFGWIEHGEWRHGAAPASTADDDIVVRMPMPKRPLHRPP